MEMQCIKSRRPRSKIYIFRYTLHFWKTPAMVYLILFHQINIGAFYICNKNEYQTEHSVVMVALNLALQSILPQSYNFFSGLQFSSSPVSITNASDNDSHYYRIWLKSTQSRNTITQLSILVRTNTKNQLYTFWMVF